VLDDPERTLLGDDQEAWLDAELGGSTARWKILGQQVMVGQLPQFLNVDQWDGYPAARDRLFDAIAATDDVVVLTGDIHSSWGIDIRDRSPTTDPIPAPAPRRGGGGARITSPAPAALAERRASGRMPHMKLVELSRNGYVPGIDADRVQAGGWPWTPSRRLRGWRLSAPPARALAPARPAPRSRTLASPFDGPRRPPRPQLRRGGG
jgi:alkaline phosphatase D